MPESNTTKKEFACALKQLLREKPFSAIHVGDICTLCQKNRKSFYYHFKDKYDLSCWIFQSELIATLRPHGENYEDGWDIFADICRYFYDNRTFYRKIMKVDGQNSFRDYFGETIGDYLRITLTDIPMKDADPDFCATFCADALLASVEQWLNASSPLPPEKYVAKVRECVDTLGVIRRNTPNRSHTDRLSTEKTE